LVAAEVERLLPEDAVRLLAASVARLFAAAALPRALRVGPFLRWVAVGVNEAS
jgi:hypothetical protein